MSQKYIEIHFVFIVYKCSRFLIFITHLVKEKYEKMKHFLSHTNYKIYILKYRVQEYIYIYSAKYTVKVIIDLRRNVC